MHHLSPKEILKMHGEALMHSLILVVVESSDVQAIYHQGNWQENKNVFWGGIKEGFENFIFI